MKLKLTNRIKIGLIVRPPKWFRLLAGPTIWQMETSKNELFITFDDGPIPELTPWVLDTLKTFNAKATFFCVGDNVQKYPDLYERIRTDGHGVGNHTFSHLNGFRSSIRRYVLDVFKARKHIESKLFRPPYGRLRGWARQILKTHQA